MDLSEYIDLLLAGPERGPRGLDGIRRRFILDSLAITSDISGHVAEFGCWQGHTSAFITESLKHISPEKELHVYDTFAGLTGRQQEDIGDFSKEFVEGAICASKEKFLATQKNYEVKSPVIHQVDVCKLHPAQVTPFSFVFLDMDYYAPTYQALACVWPKMPKGAMLLIDDYFFACTPGVPRAVQKFFSLQKISLPTHQLSEPVTSMADLNKRQCFRASYALGIRKMD